MFNVAEDTKNIAKFTSQAGIIILSALPIVLIDIYFQKYRNQNSSKLIMRNLLSFTQFIVSILYVYFIMIIFNKFSNHFQITLPGMFFPGIFFSLQYNMFTDIHESIEIILKVKKV